MRRMKKRRICHRGMRNPTQTSKKRRSTCRLRRQPQFSEPTWQDRRLRSQRNQRPSPQAWQEKPRQQLQSRQLPRRARRNPLQRSEVPRLARRSEGLQAHRNRRLLRRPPNQPRPGLPRPSPLFQERLRPSQSRPRRPFECPRRSAQSSKRTHLPNPHLLQQPRRTRNPRHLASPNRLAKPNPPPSLCVPRLRTSSSRLRLHRQPLHRPAPRPPRRPLLHPRHHPNPKKNSMHQPR